MHRMRTAWLWRLAWAALLAAALPIAAAQADKRNNILVVGFQNEVDTLDPATGFAGSDYGVLYSIYDRLVNFDPKTMEPKPGLATEWSFDGPDKRDFTMTLRHGVTFQDGTPLDAEAVKASLMHFKDTKRLNDLDVVTSIDVVAPDKVVLHLKQEYSVLPAVLSDRAGMIVSPTALAKIRQGLPAQSGRRRTVHAEELVARHGDRSRALSRLLGREAHPAQRHPVQDPPQPDGRDQRHPVRPGGPHLGRRPEEPAGAARQPKPARRCRAEHAISLHGAERHDLPPVDNKLVRQAMNMSVDRKAIGDAILGPGNSGGAALMLAPPASFAHTAGLDASVPYDPAKAKALLAKAGFPDGITLKVCGSPTPGIGTDITDIETRADEAGRHHARRHHHERQRLPSARSTRRKDFQAWQGAFSGRPDPFLTYAQNFMLDRPIQSRPAGLRRGRAPSSSIARTYSQAEQKPIYDELNKLCIENAPFILLVYVPNFAVYGQRRRRRAAQPAGQARPHHDVFVK